MKFRNRHEKSKMKVRIVVVSKEGILPGKDTREFSEVKKKIHFLGGHYGYM